MYEFNNFSQPNNTQDTSKLAKDYAREKYSRIALMMAAFSILLSQTIIASLIMAGIAFMLAVLSVKGNARPQNKALIAMLLSVAAIAITLFIVVTTITQVLIPALTDPSVGEELRAFYAEYGLDFDEVMAPFLKIFGGNH